MKIQDAFKYLERNPTTGVVISPKGRLFTFEEIKIMQNWSNESVFGEWKIRQDPVVFVTNVDPVIAEKCGKLQGIAVEGLYDLIHRKVRVTVEVIE